MVKAALIPTYAKDPSVLPGFDGPVGYRRKDGMFTFSDMFKDWMFLYQDGRCGYCGVVLGDTWFGNRKAHVEHIVCRAHGGDDLPPNVMYACSTCNNQKRDLHFSVLAERIQFRESVAAGIITINQAHKLIAAGINLGFKPAKPFHFSKMNWKHVYAAVAVDRQRMAEEFNLSISEKSHVKQP